MQQAGKLLYKVGRILGKENAASKFFIVHKVLRGEKGAERKSDDEWRQSCKGLFHFL